MVYSCTDTFQYIHVVSTHIQDNVLICLVYVAVFSQCAQMYQLYELLWCPFGVSQVSFLFENIKIYLQISLQKIQFCENHPSILWFTLLDIVNNDKINIKQDKWYMLNFISVQLITINHTKRVWLIAIKMFNLLTALIYIYSGYGKYSDPLKFFTLCYIAAIC